MVSTRRSTRLAEEYLGFFSEERLYKRDLGILDLDPIYESDYSKFSKLTNDWTTSIVDAMRECDTMLRDGVSECYVGYKATTTSSWASLDVYDFFVQAARGGAPGAHDTTYTFCLYAQGGKALDGLRRFGPVLTCTGDKFYKSPNFLPPFSPSRDHLIGWREVEEYGSAVRAWAACVAVATCIKSCEV